MAVASETSAATWHALADRVLAGHRLTNDEGVSILRSADEQLLDVLSAAFRIRRRWFGKTVQLYFLINAKSGICPENCSYCSQSRDSKADIPKYNLVGQDDLLRGAVMAHERNASTYCIVISARGPSRRELQTLEEIVPEIKRRYPLKVCASLGLLTPEHVRQLKRCGVDRINHNVNTSQQYYREICTTHTHQDRLDTLRAVREEGLEICSGGIVGLGEKPSDLVDMALELRDLEAQSIPINFLNPIEGTPLKTAKKLDPRYCLRALAMFRFANPATEIRIAGGRELHLGSLQALGLYAANSLFVGDYLTTKGQAAEMDYKMIEQLGFTVAPRPENEI